MSWRDRLLMKLMGNKIVLRLMSIPIVMKILTKEVQAFSRVTSLFSRNKEKKMAEEEEKKPVCIVNEAGATVMDVNSMGREGDKIVIEGRMMGAWPSQMYVSPEDAWRMVGMMIKNRAIIFYAFSLPFILLKRRKGKTGQ